MSDIGHASRPNILPFARVSSFLIMMPEYAGAYIFILITIFLLSCFFLCLLCRRYPSSAVREINTAFTKLEDKDTKKNKEGESERFFFFLQFLFFVF